MSKISFYLHKIKTTKKSKIIKRIFERLMILMKTQGYKYRDRHFDTRQKYSQRFGMINPIPVETKDLDVSKIDRNFAEELWRMYRNHRFDLLGSGWVNVGFHNNSKGFMEYRYDSVELEIDKHGKFLEGIQSKKSLKSSQKIWRLIDGDYSAIDWQKDFISGYRWGAEHWYLPQGNAKKLGGDIKVPWELSRLQHLPRLAILALVFPDRKNELKSEFRNELLDFIAQNPVRMGVNYMCTMDVGIRTANMALGYSLFVNQGIKFDKEFNEVFLNSLFEHCNHIRKNLEWSEILTSNHYFANIAGLLYGSFVLPECRQKNEWMKFSYNQFLNEIRKQFNREGSNKEGSTAYHRLTGEMALYSTALLHRLSDENKNYVIPQDIFDIVYGAGYFTKSITRPDGSIIQIGDNDSGMFFRLSITGNLLTPEKAKILYKNLENYKCSPSDVYYLDENMNDCRTFVSSVSGLYKNNRFKEEQQIYPLESSIVSSLVNNNKVNADLYSAPILTQTLDQKLAYENQHIIQYNHGITLNNIETYGFHEFGVYILKSKNLFLAFNASDNGQNGNAGHAHNDKMSVDLVIEDNIIFEDPGNYVYTSMPDLRNEFRSTSIHNTIYAGCEQNDIINLFSMKSYTQCYVIKFEKNECDFYVKYKDVIHRRRIVIGSDKIIIHDFSNKKIKTNFLNKFSTKGYGKIIDSR